MVDPVGNVLVDGETGSTLFEHFGAQNALASANVYQVGIILLCCVSEIQKLAGACTAA